MVDVCDRTKYGYSLVIIRMSIIPTYFFILYNTKSLYNH